MKLKNTETESVSQTDDILSQVRDWLDAHRECRLPDANITFEEALHFTEFSWEIHLNSERLTPEVFEKHLRSPLRDSSRQEKRHHQVWQQFQLFIDFSCFERKASSSTENNTPSLDQKALSELERFTEQKNNLKKHSFLHRLFTYLWYPIQRLINLGRHMFKQKTNTSFEQETLKEFKEKLKSLQREHQWPLINHLSSPNYPSEKETLAKKRNELLEEYKARVSHAFKDFKKKQVLINTLTNHFTNLESHFEEQLIPEIKKRLIAAEQVTPSPSPPSSPVNLKKTHKLVIPRPPRISQYYENKNKNDKKKETTSAYRLFASKREKTKENDPLWFLEIKSTQKEQKIKKQFEQLSILHVGQLVTYLFNKKPDIDKAFEKLTQSRQDSLKEKINEFSIYQKNRLEFYFLHAKYILYFLNSSAINFLYCPPENIEDKNKTEWIIKYHQDQYYQYKEFINKQERNTRIFWHTDQLKKENITNSNLTDRIAECGNEILSWIEKEQKNLSDNFEQDILESTSSVLGEIPEEDYVDIDPDMLEEYKDLQDEERRKEYQKNYTFFIIKKTLEMIEKDLTKDLAEKVITPTDDDSYIKSITEAHNKRTEERRKEFEKTEAETQQYKKGTLENLKVCKQLLVDKRKAAQEMEIELAKLSSNESPENKKTYNRLSQKLENEKLNIEKLKNTIINTEKILEEEAEEDHKNSYRAFQKI